MKKVYIDGGARVGESIEIYVKKDESLIGCDIHLFECNPNHINDLLELQKINLEYNIFVHNAALWNENGERDFYFSIDQWGDLGCTLNKNKSERLDLENPIKVKTVRLSDFLNQFNEEDYIIVKLDIEGAEYEVVKDLLDTGKMSCIKEIYVEWHDFFYGGLDFEYLRKELKQYANLKYDIWDY